MEFIKDYNRKIVFADGTEYYGYAFGADLSGAKVCELVFNTSMVGYPEIVADPSYAQKAVMLTYPLIGNYGVATEDFEVNKTAVSALITRDYNNSPSNFRCTYTLDEVLKQNNIPAVYGMDTREITRRIRDNGTCLIAICSADFPKDEAVEMINNFKPCENIISTVSCDKMWIKKSEIRKKFNVVVIDCGLKLSLLHSLTSRGCDVTVVPYNTSADEIIKLSPNGVFVSNGPECLESAKEVVDTVKQLIGKTVIFGTALGCEILAKAMGAELNKLPFGHRGCNLPVKNLNKKELEFANQNNSYAIDEESLKSTTLSVTHINLMDNTVAGVESVKDNAFGSMFYPEGAGEYLVDKFVMNMQEVIKNA